VGKESICHISQKRKQPGKNEEHEKKGPDRRTCRRGNRPAPPKRSRGKYRSIPDHFPEKRGRKGPLPGAERSKAGERGNALGKESSRPDAEEKKLKKKCSTAPKEVEKSSLPRKGIQ